MSLSLSLDLRHALRDLRRHPRAALVPILTLAIGIGAATTVFSVVNGVLLRPLPYSDPERLINVWNDIGDGPSMQSLPAISATDWKFYRQNTKAFIDFAGAVGGIELGQTGIVGGAGVTPERITLGGLSSNFLPLLGVKPLLGRGFLPEEDEVGGPRTVLLSHRYWVRRFNADSGVIGKSVEIDDVARTVVGVLPETFRLLHPAETYMLRDSDIWVPLQLDWVNGRNGFTVYTVIGRMKPGVTLAQAQQDLDALAIGLRAERPVYQTTPLKIRGVPLHHDVVKSVRPGLLVLLAAVGLLVVIACANVANLLLARASGREREVAIRLAIGASRVQVVRQLLIESLVLTLVAGTLGFLIAFAVLWFLDAVQPANIPRLSDIGIDARVMLFAAGLLVTTTVLSGLAPALHAARRSTASLLGGARVANHGRQPMLRNALIVGEVALSVILLVGAGLLARSFMRLQAVRPGFLAEGAQTFHVALPRAKYQFESRRAFTSTLTSELKALPGVTAVGATSNLPLTGQGPTMLYAYDGKPDAFTSQHAERLTITPEFFAASGTRLLAGRAFTDADDGEAPQVVIIDELIAKAGWPNESPIGKRLQVAGTTTPAPYATIVGVAEHVRSGDLREDGLPQIYWAYNARPSGTMSYVVRSSRRAHQVAAAAQRAVTSIDAAVPVTNVAPMTQYVRAASAQARFTLVLMEVVGGLAVFLAGVGLYSVIAFVVAQRTREFGIRLALGETPGRLSGRVVRRGLWLVGASAAVGVIGAALAVRSIEPLLYQVNPYDPRIFSAVVAFLLAVGAAACYAPARRASRADPLVALRSE